MRSGSLDGCPLSTPRLSSACLTICSGKFLGILCKIKKNKGKNLFSRHVLHDHGKEGMNNTFLGSLLMNVTKLHSHYGQRVSPTRPMQLIHTTSQRCFVSPTLVNTSVLFPNILFSRTHKLKVKNFTTQPGRTNVILFT